MKLPLEDLNPGPCPLHPISIYTCGVTIASRVCNGKVYVVIVTLTKHTIFVFQPNRHFNRISDPVQKNTSTFLYINPSKIQF